MSLFQNDNRIKYIHSDPQIRYIAHTNRVSIGMENGDGLSLVGETKVDSLEVGGVPLETLISNGNTDAAVDDVTLEYNTGVIQLKDSGVTSSKIASAAITGSKIASSSITSVKLNSGSVTSVKLADASVSTGKIIDSAVTNSKLLNSGITISTTGGLAGGAGVVLGGSIALSLDSSVVKNDSAITFSDTTESLGYDSGGITLAGGLGITKRLNVKDSIVSGAHNVVPDDEGVYTSYDNDKYVGLYSDNSFSHKLKGFGDCVLHIMNEPTRNITIASETTSGGLDIANSGMSGKIRFRSTGVASNSTNAAVQFSGGIAVAKNIITGGDIRIDSNTPSVSKSVGGLVVNGGVGVTGDLYCTNIYADNIATTPTVGTVTQLTSKTTDVTLNTRVGVIETFTTGVISTHAGKFFTVNNTLVTSSSVIMLTIMDTGLYGLTMSVGLWGEPTAGSFDIAIYNCDSNDSTDRDYKIMYHILN